MNANFSIHREYGIGGDQNSGAEHTPRFALSHAANGANFNVFALVENWIDTIAPCAWPAHGGVRPSAIELPHRRQKLPLYTPEERLRRDASLWTMVQAILAPLQFLAFAVSLTLVLRYLMTGRGYEIATLSILIKTVALYAIMITGSIWEKEVFGKYLFARSFFWEDVFSMLVLALQSAYLGALMFGWGTPRAQMFIAIAAYAAYAINAAQFVLKLRAARLEGARTPAPGGVQTSPYA